MVESHIHLNWSIALLLESVAFRIHLSSKNSKKKKKKKSNGAFIQCPSIILIYKMNENF